MSLFLTGVVQFFPELILIERVDDPGMLFDLKIEIEKSELHVHGLDKFPLDVFWISVRCNPALLHRYQLMPLINISPCSPFFSSPKSSSESPLISLLSVSSLPSLPSSILSSRL